MPSTVAEGSHLPNIWPDFEPRLTPYLETKQLYKVTKVIDFCYGHRLLEYEGKCRFPHGHNGRLEVDIESDELNELGMVRDFSEVKAIVKGWIDENLDYRMILNCSDPMVEFFKEQNEPIYVIDKNPTAEAIAELIFNYSLNHGLPVTEVRLWETMSSYATFNLEKAQG